MDKDYIKDRLFVNRFGSADSHSVFIKQ